MPDLQAVIDKVRQRVSPEDFIHFKQQSGLFMRGEASAQAFHIQVVSLGLAALLPDLAALCPDATKRTDLLEVHRTTFVKENTTKVSHTLLTLWGGGRGGVLAEGGVGRSYGGSLQFFLHVWASLTMPMHSM